jgi:hypothetical protein
VLVSGLVWLAAGFVALAVSRIAAMVTLFVGGMLIYPVAVGLCKAVGRPATVSRNNPLNASAKEVTVLFVLCMPFAYVVAQAKPEWFFPGMLLLIGGRYLTFHTLYGLKVFLAFGAALIAAGFALLRLQALFNLGPFIGAAIELLFATFVIGVGKREGAFDRSLH